MVLISPEWEREGLCWHMGSGWSSGGWGTPLLSLPPRAVSAHGCQGLLLCYVTFLPCILMVGYSAVGDMWYELRI